MTEKQFEEKFKRWLTKHGIYKLGTPSDAMDTPPRGYYIKRWGGGQYVQAGLPDMQVVIDGICYEIELKSETGKPSELQVQKIGQINLSDGNALILKPQNYNNFINKITIKHKLGG